VSEDESRSHGKLINIEAAKAKWASKQKMVKSASKKKNDHSPDGFSPPSGV
jgi:hypothetical protein